MSSTEPDAQTILDDETIAGKISNTRCSYLLDLPRDQRPKNSYPLIPLEIL